MKKGPWLFMVYRGLYILPSYIMGLFHKTISYKDPGIKTNQDFMECHWWVLSTAHLTKVFRFERLAS